MQQQRNGGNERLGSTRPSARKEKVSDKLSGVAKARRTIPNLIKGHVTGVGEFKPVSQLSGTRSVINDKEEGGVSPPTSRWQAGKKGIADNRAVPIVLE